MEEYVGSEEEATLELQAIVTKEEQPKIRIETKTLIEEGRKRKRNEEEGETEQEKEDETDEFISNRPFVIMENTLVNKDFIGERGFNELTSLFKEVIEHKGWSLLCEHKPVRFTAVVREFFANLVGRREKTCYVRGKWISFDRIEINKVFNLSKLKDGSKFKRLQKDPDHQKIVELFTTQKREWNSTKKKPFDSISRGSLTKEAKV